MSKNYCLQISRPGDRGGEGFSIRFSCKRSKQYVEFGINIIFKGLLHILMNSVFFYFFVFSFLITSSRNIASV